MGFVLLILGPTEMLALAAAMISNDNKKPKTSVRRALSLAFLEKFISFAFSIASIVILSRLLTPAEVGVFSIAAGLLALVHMLRDFGAGEFLVQEKALDEATVRTVFTVSLLIAWSLGILILAGSGAIGRFYADPGVARVLRVMSIILFLLPLSTTTHALLSRELEFGKLTKIHTIESVARSCAKIALAYAGFSYMSLAWGAVVGIVLMTAGYAFWGRRYRVRGFSLTRWKEVLHFGSNRTVADLANQLGGESANLVIGKMLGMGDAGLYSRGYGVVNMFRANVGGAIESVAFPAFAREHRESGQAPELFLKALVYTTGISWPFFACGIILAYPIIRIMFGEQWDGAVPLMRWLCAAALVGTLMYQCNRFLVAVGRVRTVTRVEVIYQLARIGITVGAAFFGVVAVAASQVLVYTIAAALYYWTMRVYKPLVVSNCAKALVSSVVVTLATCLVPVFVTFWPGLVGGGMIPAFSVALVGGCAGWFVGIVATRHPLLGEVQRVISRLRQRSRGWLG